tara:strand:- start:624 stop:1568 length:945 start_codon:yes stop_codon:yes gene_type:complete
MIPVSLTSQLANAADTEINRILRIGATACKQSKPTGEVGFVAAFVLGAVPAIAAAWRPILSPAGYSVSMTGIFCHQTPRATFTNSAGLTKSCELSDLLVVVDDMTSGVPTSRWAVLIQAKMAASHGGQSLSGAGDLTQLDLMTHWPAFSLPSTFPPGARNFSTCSYSGTNLDCGRYGLIEPQPTPLWHQQAPAPKMPAGGDELGTFLAKMLESGQTGYGREATGRFDDWSRTVDDLMNVTAKTAFTYSAGLKGPHPRGNTAIALVVCNPSGSDFTNGYWMRDTPPSGGDPESPDDDSDAEGMSFVHIGVLRKEE